MSIQRDPHLPPPEVCDWLLAQEWSEVVPTAVTSFPASGPSGITKHEAYDHVYARAALGANEIFAIEMPVEALQLLEEDAWIRREAIGNSAEYGILPMIISETGASNEPVIERIICSSISGGANYVNNMPHTLSLERVTPDATYHATYMQATPPDAWLPSVCTTEDSQP